MNCRKNFASDSIHLLLLLFIKTTTNYHVLYKCATIKDANVYLPNFLCPQIYPSLLEQPRPCLSPKTEEEKEEHAEKLG